MTGSARAPCITVRLLGFRREMKSAGRRGLGDLAVLVQLGLGGLRFLLHPLRVRMGS